MSGTVTPADLLQAAREGDNQACEQVLEENNGLIWSVVRRYYGRGVEPEDLYQLGCLGFLKAVRGFDPSYGTQFSTYAVPKIAGEIRRFLRDDGAVKVSRGLKERGTALRSVRSRLCGELGREPVLSELAQATGLTPEEIAAAETATEPVVSLQSETGDGLTLEGVLSGGEMEEGLVERLALRTAIERLPERERQVLLLRYYKGLTQTQSAKVLGVSQVQVSRLERRAIEKIRKILSGPEQKKGRRRCKKGKGLGRTPRRKQLDLAGQYGNLPCCPVLLCCGLMICKKISVLFLEWCGTRSACCCPASFRNYTCQKLLTFSTFPATLKVSKQFDISDCGKECIPWKM